MGRPVVDGTPEPPPTAGPDVLGQFAAPQTWPMVPVHLALMSDGTVAAWDGFEAAVNSERRWDPATGQFLSIATGRNLFCAGHINLQDGRLLVVGGHIEAYEGTKDTNLFNPSGSTWQRGQDMSVARWYPTATALPDGRVLVVSGDNVTLKEPNQPVPLTDASNTLPSIYDPATDTWTDMPTVEPPHAALPVHVRPAERQALRRRPRPDHADARPLDRPVDDGRHERHRRPQRGHVPAGQGPEVRHLERPGVPGPRGDQPRRRRST